MDFLRFLKDKKANVRGFDPVAMDNAKKTVSDIEYASDVWSAVEDADGIVIATEWNEFRTMDMKRLRELMKGNVVVDLKNIYEPAPMKELGFVHLGVGRGSPGSSKAG
jgi:UDPglucose 6-dehydrogenase